MFDLREKILSLKLIKIIASRAFVIRSVSQRHPTEGIDGRFIRRFWIIVFGVSRLLLLFRFCFSWSCFVCDLYFCFGFFDSLDDLFISCLFRPIFNVFKIFEVVGNFDSELIQIKIIKNQSLSQKKNGIHLITVLKRSQQDYHLNQILICLPQK